MDALSMRRVALVAVLALIFAASSVEGGCGRCMERKCSGKRIKICVCVPNFSGDCNPIPKKIPLPTVPLPNVGGIVATLCPSCEKIKKKIEEARQCLEKPFDCAQKELFKILPDLDTTQCKTEEMKSKATDGGWSVYYGPRVWDSKIVGNTVALFFPLTAEEAAKNLYNELRNQTTELVRALEFAVQQEQDASIGNLKNLLQSMFSSLIAKGGKTPGVAFNKNKFGVKLQFYYVQCNNELPGGLTLPSEGYIRWVFGWRLNSEISVRFANLKNGEESDRSSLDTGGVTKLPVVRTMTLRMNNACRFPIRFAASWKLPSNEGRVCSNGNIQPNGWCVDGIYSLQPGSSMKVGTTLNTIFYFTAFTRDKQLLWEGTRRWTLKDKPCTAGSPGCYSWREIKTGTVLDTYTQTLTCPTPSSKYSLQPLLSNRTSKLTPNSAPVAFSLVSAATVANAPGPIANDTSSVVLGPAVPTLAPVIDAARVPGSEVEFAPATAPGAAVNFEDDLVLPPDVTKLSDLLDPVTLAAADDLAKSPSTAVRAENILAALGTPNAGALPVVRFFDAGPPAVGSPNLAVEEIQAPFVIDGPLPPAELEFPDAPSSELPASVPTPSLPTIRGPRSATPATAPSRSVTPAIAPSKSVTTVAATPTGVLRPSTSPSAAPPSTTRPGVPPSATLAPPPLRAAVPPPPLGRKAPAPAPRAATTTSSITGK